MFRIALNSHAAKSYILRTALRNPPRGVALSFLVKQTVQRYNPIFKTALTMAKRKASTLAQGAPTTTAANQPSALDDGPPPKRRASQRKPSTAKPKPTSTNPNINANVLDAPGALRASPDADEPDERMNLEQAGMNVEKQVKDEDVDEEVPSLTNGVDSDSSLSEMSDIESPVKAEPPAKGAKTKVPAKAKINGVSSEKAAPKDVDSSKGKKDPSKGSQFLDPEDDGLEEADEEEIQAALSRPPPVNSDYLPLPWKGRLGYVRAPIVSYLLH